MIRRRRWQIGIAAFILALLLGAGGMAGAQQSAPLPEPYPELQELAFTAGDWDVTGEVRLANGEWVDFSGVSVIDWHLQDHALLEELTAVAGDQIIMATSLRAFGANDRWQMAWGDTVSHPVRALTGQWQDANQLYFTSRGIGEVWDIVLTRDGEDAFTLTIAIAEKIGRSFEPFWNARYTRRADPITTLTAGAELPQRPDKAGQFDFWVGEWTMESQYSNADEGETFPAQDTVRHVIGGYAIEEHVRAESPNGPFVAYSLSRYNPGTDAWDNIWFGTGGRRMQTFRGTCDEQPNLCKLAGYFYDVHEGVDEFVWAIPNAEAPNWFMTFTRVE